MRPLLVAALSAALITVPLSSLTAKTPDTWDGLYLVQDKSHGTVYLLPGVDFRKYSKVMLDPTEVAFRKDWQKGAAMGQRVGSTQMRRILDEAGVKFGKSLTAALQKRGYVIVQQPGDDVLRIWPAVINLSFAVPHEGAGMSRTYTNESGYATLVIEARDSVSGALLGRALDIQSAGDDMVFITNRVTLWHDFERLFDDWSRQVATGLDRLRSTAPLEASAQ